MTNQEIEDTGFYAIYLMMGAEHYMNVMRNREQITDGFGHTWLAEVMAHKGRRVAEFLKARPYRDNHNGGGVFAYDVVEGLGAWIILNIDAEKSTQYAALVDGHVDYSFPDRPFMVELEARHQAWITEHSYKQTKYDGGTL